MSYMENYDEPYDEPYDDLPDNLLTCFSKSQLSIYEKAIEEYKKSNPDVNLVISTENGNNMLNDPALYILSARTDLTEFWRLFEEIKSNIPVTQ